MLGISIGKGARYSAGYAPTEKQALEEVLFLATPLLFLLLMFFKKSFDTKEDEYYSGMSHKARKGFERYAENLED